VLPVSVRVRSFPRRELLFIVGGTDRFVDRGRIRGLGNLNTSGNLGEIRLRTWCRGVRSVSSPGA
jgi:hypothetical protein